MAGLWFAAGIGLLIAHVARFEVPYGSPATMLVTSATLFLGLGAGTLAGHWWKPSSRALPFLEKFPRATASAFWIVFGLFGLWTLRGSAVSAPWCAGAWFGYMVGLGREESSHAPPFAVRRSRAASRIAVSGFLVFTPLFGDALLRALSLDISDTIGDYRSANVEDSVRFRLRLCRNGECLTKQDWACGFTNGDEEAFDRCFDMVEAKAPSSITLDDARKYCGNVTMRFVGERYSTPEKCQAAGGNWGIKTVPPRLGF